MTLGKIIIELRKINEVVPKPLRLPTLDEVDATETTLGVKFHPDYRKYLLEASDIVHGALEPATVTPDGGHTDLIEICRSAWGEMSLPKDLLPICEDNGDYFCMEENGKVVYWSHDGVADESWPNLASWIENVWLNKNAL